MNQSYINHRYNFINHEGLNTLKSEIIGSGWTIDTLANSSLLVRTFRQDGIALTSQSPGDY